MKSILKFFTPYRPSEFIKKENLIISFTKFYEIVSECDIVIFNYKEDIDFANKVRTDLYSLVSPSKKLSILDLGTLHKIDKKTNNIIIKELKLLKAKIIIIGRNDTLLEIESDNIIKNEDHLFYTIINNRLSIPKFLKKNKIKRTFLSNIGTQAYFNNESEYKTFENNNHWNIRLKEINTNISVVEPTIRDSHIVDIDISVLRKNEFPDIPNADINGINSVDICMIAKYIGFSENIQIIKISGFKEKSQDLSSIIISKIIWHFLESLKIKQFQKKINLDLEKIIFYSEILDDIIIFYRNPSYNLWWFEILDKKKSKKNIACLESDYQDFKNSILPKKWMSYKKIFN